MTRKILTKEPHITLGYDVLNDILLADWTGNQTKESVMDGCERMLTYLKMYRISKVLNDNTNVTSIWDDAAEWVAVDWFPRMHQAGCSKRRMSGVAVGIIKGIAKYYNESDIVSVKRLTAPDEERVQIQVDFLN